MALLKMPSNLIYLDDVATWLHVFPRTVLYAIPGCNLGSTYSLLTIGLEMKFKTNLRDWLKGPNAKEITQACLVVKDSNDVSQEAIRATDVPGSSTLSLSHDVAPPFISNTQETTTNPTSSLQRLDSVPKYGLGVLCGPPEPLEKAKNAEEKKQRRKDARRDGQETDHNHDKPTRPIVE